MTTLATQRIIFRSTTALTLALAIVAAPSAFAQEGADRPATNAPAASDAADKDIVVTGTLLRGIAPVGTNSIAVTRQDIVATGAQSSNDLLATIPQISNFNTIPTGQPGFGQPIVSTNLRNLGASGGTTTLTLVNGHRIVGSGILQTYVDPQIIPPGIVERVEVIPDGGSSIYGSDAIGGVINFITRKRFNGIEATGHYGFADGYNTWDANVTAGKDWGTGSLSVSYAYAWHNNIQGYERNYVTQNYTGFGGPDNRSRSCTPGNVAVTTGVAPSTTTTFYALPGLVAGTVNRCSTTDFSDIYPREERHTVFATLDQDLSDHLTTNITAYYSRRTTTAMEATLNGSGPITNANPYFRPVGTETSQTVYFDFAPVFGRGTPSPSRFDSWGITPTFDADLGHDWHLRGLANYGHSYNNTIEYPLNASNLFAALAGTTTATALNPYNVAATNPAVLTSLRDYSNYSVAKQDLMEARLVADGKLLSLPGGDVKLAIGGEYHYEKIAANIVFGSAAAPFANSARASRQVASVYGELFVPIVGADNAMPGIQALDLTGSLRYDHYDDVGGTTNPKIGFNYKPVEWLTFRGNWGTSFHAPSLADTTGAVDSRISFTTGIGYTGGVPLIWISGGNPNLKPEKAHTWSLGADLTMPFYRPLKISATYYNIDFTDIITVNAGGFFGSSFYNDPLNNGFYMGGPNNPALTLAQAQAYVGSYRPDNFASIAQLFSTYGGLYSILDLRRVNRGRLKQDGIDFNVSWNQETSFGSVNASFGGTYTLNRKSSPANNGVYTQLLDNGFGRFNFMATFGATAGPVTGRGQWNHTGGYPVLFDATQSRVGAFDTADLYLALDLEKVGWMKATSLTLNVNNVFDQNPPFRTAGSGYTNGSTLGRLFQFGVRTKF